MHPGFIHRGFASGLRRWLTAALGLLVLLTLGAPNIFAQTDPDIELLYYDDFDRQAAVYELSGLPTTPGEGWRVTSGIAFIIDNGVGRTISERHEGLLSAQSPYPFNLAYYTARASTRSFGTAGDPSTYGQAPQNTFRVIQKDWQLSGSYTVEARFQVTKIRWQPGISGGFGVSLLLNWNDAENVHSLDNRSWYVVQIRFADANHTMQIARRSHHAHLDGLDSDLNYFGLSPTRYFTVPDFPGLVENVWYTLKVQVEADESTLQLSVYIKTDEDEAFRLLGRAVDTGRLFEIHGGKVYFAGPPHTTGVLGIRSDYADVEFDYVKVYRERGV